MKDSLSRRSFLKTSALASLWTAGGCAGFPSILSSRSPNRKLGHACIGTANMAGYDLKQFLKNDDVEIVALCDVDADYLAKAGKLVPGARLYTDWRELLAKEGDRIDSVNVSTPDHGHAVQVTAALAAGKNVYAQKPLCKYFDECLRIRELAAKSGRVTQLGTQFAASPCDRRAVAIMQSGVLGPVRRVILFSTRPGGSRVKRTFPVPGAVPANLDWDKWIGPAPMRPYAPGYHPVMWRKFTDFGSGWIGDLCIHVASAPWQGLDLGDALPMSVRAEVDAETLVNPAGRGCWPRYSHIVWQMPAVKASGGKAFTMEWCSGFSDDLATPGDFMPPEVCHRIAAKTPDKTLPYEGCVVETDAAYLLIPHSWEACTLTALMKDGTSVPPLPAVGDAPSHFDEYVARCFDGKPALSDFSWSTRMMDAVLMGGVAERLPGRSHRFDPVSRTFDSAEATRISRSSYREGWHLA